MPWQDTSPLAAALGAATGYFAGKKEKSDEAYKRSEQALQDKLQKETVDAQLQALGSSPVTPMPGGTAPIPVSPMPIPAPSKGSGATGTSSDGKSPIKTLGTVVAHGTAPPASTQPTYDQLITWAQTNAMNNQVAGHKDTAKFWLDRAAQYQVSKSGADKSAQAWLTYQMDIAKNEAQAHHWGAQETETHRHNLETEAQAIRNNQTSIERANIAANASTTNASTAASSRWAIAHYVQPQITGRTKYVQGATTSRANAAINALGAGAGSTGAPVPSTTPPPAGGQTVSKADATAEAKKQGVPLQKYLDYLQSQGWTVTP